MKSPTRQLITALSTALAVSAAVFVATPAYAATSTIVASPDGSGSTCSLTDPCSLTGAQTKARDASASGNAVDVQLRGGTYTLAQTFTLESQDSGTSQAPVTYRAYPGETPTLTGARALSSWTDLGGGVYSAPTDGADFRQLYVDDVRATPARYPNVGSYVQLQASDRDAQTLSIQSSQFSAFGNADLSQVDMVMQLQWGETYMRLKGATNAGDLTRLTLQDTEAGILFQRPYPLLSDGSPIHFENAREFLDQPGEFFVDRKAGRIYYMPRAGESLSSRFTVPTVDTLLDVAGTASAPVHDIAIRGIAFRDSNWTRPTTSGYINGQGGLYNLSANMQNQQYTDRPPAAVQVNYADRIEVTDNTFARMGSTALDLNTAVHDSNVTGNVITDTSGNGIMVGKFTDADVEYHTPYHPADLNEVTARVTIANNVISGTGKVYYGTASINGGYLRNVSIVHNDLSDSPWAAITTGWGWASEETAQRENTISYNRIHNVVNMLCDTAGIYHLSNDPGTVFEGNYMHDIVRTPTACTSAVAGFYMDEGSDNLTLRNNVLADTDNFINYNRVGGNVVNSGNVTESTQIIQASGVESAYRGLLQKINLAAGKPTVSSSEYSGYTLSGNAVDGDPGTGWSPTGADTSAWWQVDLGSAQPIAQVSLTTRQDMDQPETRRDFEIRGSNDPTFASYAVLARRDGATIADAGTFSAKVNDTGSYRYLRVAKTTTQYFWITEFSAQAATGVGGAPATATFDPNTAYTLTNVNSGLAADVYGASTDDGAEIAQWQLNGGAKQKWYLRRATGNLFTIVSADSGKALDNSSAQGRGEKIRQYTLNGQAQQLWTIEPRGDSFVIRNFKSQQVLEVGGASKDNGARLNQWMDVTQANGLWKIDATN